MTHFGTGPEPGDGGPDVGSRFDGGVDADRVDGDTRPDSAFVDARRIDAEPPPPPPPPPPRDSGPVPVDARPTDAPPADADPPPVDAGTPSRALAFESGDRVLIAPSVALDLTTSHTYELWVRPRGDGLVLHKGDVRAGERYQYLMEIRGGNVVAGWATEEGEAQVAGPITMGVWTHVSVVIEADPGVAFLTLYIDGVSVARRRYRNTLFDALNDQPLLMGAGFVGDIDEVRIFTYARRAWEIPSTMWSRLSPVPPGMEAYWPLEERGQIIIDRTLRGNEGVLGNRTFPDAADPRWIFDGPI